MGRDKTFLDFDGESLWQRQLNTLRRLQPDEILISGPPREEWKQWVVIADEKANAGPLAGVCAALRYCAGPMLLVLAIDLPMMTADYLRFLLESCGDQQGVVPTSSRGLEPLAAVYPKACLHLAKAGLESGDLSLHGFVRKACEQGLIRQQPIAHDELSLFANLNTVADYECIRSRPVR